ncbi:toprim domain-containing protein [Paenibacillus elgii]|uniref:toprim domain-containing protein n=1 Tax=Paenibacillus elgii TaxID=189691 RepID=UPI000248DEDC|nr:toprim domain-containing protein [Paenibacillus elgii]
MYSTPGTIKIRGRPVPVDVRAELERYQWGTQYRWTAGKLSGPSILRYDAHPSWFVNTDPDSPYYGCWTDSGAVDDEWRSGGFVKLLAFLRNEAYEESADYLIAMYGDGGDSPDEVPTLKLPVLVTEHKRPGLIAESVLEPYRYRHPYLEKRGISEAVQRLYDVGYDRTRRAVTIPWRLPDGRLAALKYRSTYSRVFWYERNGRPIREIVYGIDVIYKRRLKRAAIVEGEIDALSLGTAGVPAIATGGANNWTAIKRDMIVRSPLEEIVIVRDNDAAGRAWTRRVFAELSPYMAVRIALVPRRYKDVNDAWLAGVNVGALRDRAITRKLRIA